MKKIHILVPILLTASISPLISMTSCNEPEPTGIKLDKTSLDLAIGNTYTLNATIEPAEASQEVVWSSDNQAVATVADGVVTAVAKGKATITVKSKDYDISTTCVVNVTDQPEPATSGLCFEKGEYALSTSISYEIKGSLPNIDIEYSYDGIGWNDWGLASGSTNEGEELTIDDGQKLYVRNKHDRLSEGISNNYFKFQMSGKVLASGNVNSMINYAELHSSCFAYLFSGCTALEQAPELPATTLANNCYYSMFNGSSILKAPKLAAHILPDLCYNAMFKNCEQLVIPSEMEIDSVGYLSCNLMYQLCRNLEIKEFKELDFSNKNHFMFLCPEYDTVDDKSFESMFGGTKGNPDFATPNIGNAYFWNEYWA